MPPLIGEYVITAPFLNADARPNAS